MGCGCVGVLCGSDLVHVLEEMVPDKVPELEHLIPVGGEQACENTLSEHYSRFPLSGKRCTTKQSVVWQVVRLIGTLGCRQGAHLGHKRGVPEQQNTKSGLGVFLHFAGLYIAVLLWLLPYALGASGLSHLISAGSRTALVCTL